MFFDAYCIYRSILNIVLYMKHQGATSQLILITTVPRYISIWEDRAHAIKTVS